MQRILMAPQPGFRELARSERSQAATMVLAPGETTGGPDNRHGSDQWLYVISGIGTATIDTHKVQLEPGILVLIEAGERHEIRCEGDESLRTLNIYAPPEY